MTVGEKLESFEWRFAKSMPHIPHWYILKNPQFCTGDEFEDLVSHIRSHGVLQEWNGRFFTYFYYNGYKYWTMGAPVSETTVINRARA